MLWKRRKQTLKGRSQQDNFTEQEMELIRQQQEKQETEKRNAVIIQRAYRACLERRRQRKLLEKEDSKTKGLFWTNPDWAQYVPDDSMCGICGVVFEKGSTTQNEQDWLEEVKAEAEAAGTVEDVKQKHDKSQDHIEKLDLFKWYKKFYNKEVLRVVSDINKYIQKLQAETVSEALKMEIGRLEKAHQELCQKMSYVQDHREWGNRRLVTDSLEDLQRIYGDVHHRVWTIKEEEQQVRSYVNRASLVLKVSRVLKGCFVLVFANSMKGR